jgi:hypothetical protein
MLGCTNVLIIATHNVKPLKVRTYIKESVNWANFYLNFLFRTFALLPQGDQNKLLFFEHSIFEQIII